MLLEEERKLLVEYGKKMFHSNLTVNTGGNLSIYNRSKKLIVTTPTSVPYDQIRPEDICVLDINGQQIEGTFKPSVEFRMHLDLYKYRPEINAIIHAHSQYCTIYSVLNRPLKPILHLFGYVANSQVDIASYQTYGTQELADEVVKTIGKKSRAILLANHGVNVLGTDIKSTFDLLEELEYCAKIQWMCETIGAPKNLNDDEVEKLSHKFYNTGY